jgi:hypothetical protein
MTERQAWKSAIKYVGENLYAMVEIYFDGSEYSTEYTRGAKRVGYITETLDGFFQYSHATDERIELDPTAGLLRPMRY